MNRGSKYWIPHTTPPRPPQMLCPATTPDVSVLRCKHKQCQLSPSQLPTRCGWKYFWRVGWSSSTSIGSVPDSSRNLRKEAFPSLRQGEEITHKEQRYLEENIKTF